MLSALLAEQLRFYSKGFCLTTKEPKCMREDKAVYTGCFQDMQSWLPSVKRLSKIQYSSIKNILQKPLTFQHTENL